MDAEPILSEPGSPGTDLFFEEWLDVGFVRLRVATINAAAVTENPGRAVEEISAQ